MSEASSTEIPSVITLHVTLPSSVADADTIEIQVEAESALIDFRRLLASVPVCRNLTSYSVVVEGIEAIDPEITFGSLAEQAGKKDATSLKVQIKEKPYSLQGIYSQLNKFRQVIGLHYLDRVSHDFAVQSGSNKVNTLALSPISGKDEEKKEKKDKSEGEEKDDKIEPKKFDQQQQSQLDDLTKDHAPESFAKAASYSSTISKLNLPIKSLVVSQWSPVPAQQRVKGDLLYLTLQTLENDTYQITAHVSGFFVNKCSNNTFDPSIKINEKGKFRKHFLLYNLVSELSASFESAVEAFETTLTDTDLAETFVLPTVGFTAGPWIVCDRDEVKPDMSRSQLPLVSYGVDGADFVKDWNDEVQAVKELPTDTIEGRIYRDQLMLKSLHEFSVAATKEAVEIAHDNVEAMNPADDDAARIYLRNGVFCSRSDVDIDNYQTTGGDEAARYMAGKDLATVQTLNKALTSVSGADIHTVATAVVDYMGKRITAQAPVPGIFSSGPEDVEPEERVAYGLTSDKSSINNDASFEEPLKRIAETLHLKPHTVDGKKLLVSQDCKGVLGTDSRKYLIDTARSTPRDIEFIEAHWNPEDANSYPHGEALIRQEAVDLWWRHNIGLLLKDHKEGAPLPEISDKFLLNPDAFAPGVASSKADEDEVREVSKYVKETLIGDWVKSIPQNVAPFDGAHLKDSLHARGINMRYLGFIADQCIAAIDVHNKQEAAAITTNTARAEEVEKEQKTKLEEEKKRRQEAAEKRAEALKNGEQPPAEEEDEKKEEEKPNNPEDTSATFQTAVANYNVVYKLAIQEMVARAAKHLLRKLGAGVPGPVYPYLVAQFHNLLLSEVQAPIQFDATIKALYPVNTYEFMHLTSDVVADMVANEVAKRFRFQLPGDWKSVVPAATVMRQIAIKFGIQWSAHEYAFTQAAFDEASVVAQPKVVEQPFDTKSGKKGKKSKKPTTHVAPPTGPKRTSTFTAGDIVAFVPLVKDSQYKSQIIDELYASARAHVANDEKDTGLQLLTQMVAIEEQMYSRIHKETAQFYTNMSQSFAELDETTVRAAAMSRKAIAVAERTFGVDSYEVIKSYIHSAYMEVKTGGPNCLENAFKLYQHAFTTLADVYGSSDHPAVVSTLMSLAETLTNEHYFAGAKQVYEYALELSERVNGEVSQLTGLIAFRLGHLVSQTSTDLELIKDYFVRAGNVFVKLLGPDDALAKEAMTLASNVAAYIQYQKLEQEMKKQQAAMKGKVTNAVAEPVKKGKGKKGPVASDPTIASKSVDDILKYIEGGSSKKKGKKN